MPFLRHLLDFSAEKLLPHSAGNKAIESCSMLHWVFVFIYCNPFHQQ